MAKRKWPTYGQLMQESSDWCERCPFEVKDCIIIHDRTKAENQKGKCTRYRKEEKNKS